MTAAAQTMPADEVRARKILALDGFESEPKALPMRAEHMWRGENLSPVVPFTGSVLIPMGRNPDLGRLRDSVARVVGRHEALRSRLALRNGRVVQIPEDRTPQIELVDVTRADLERHRDGTRRSAVNEFFTTPINLVEETGFRCRAFCDENQDVTLGLLLHHYFGDAWSSQILRREVEAYHVALEQKESIVLPPAVQYADYGLVQRRSLDRNCAAHLTYWKERIAHAPPSALPLEKNAVAATLGRIFFRIEADLMARLKAVSQAQRVSLALICFAAHQLALAQWYGTTDVVTAILTTDRFKPEFRGTIGYLVGGMPIRSEFTGDMGLPEFLSATAKAFYGGMAHQDLPFEFHAEIFAPPSPFCTTRYNFIPGQQSYFLGDIDTTLPAFTGVVQMPPVPATQAYGDLHFLMIEYPQGLLGRVSYNTGLSFDAVMPFVERYQAILAAIAAHPEGRVRDILEKKSVIRDAF